MSQQPDSSPRITRRLETQPVEPAASNVGGKAGHADPSLEPDWSIVRLVDDESGSHVEPALDEDWPDLWKLRWHAAVVASVIGLRVQVDDADVKLNGVPLAGRYNIRCGSSTASVGSYRDAWTQLNGIKTGAQQALAAGWHPPARVAKLETALEHAYVVIDQQVRDGLLEPLRFPADITENVAVETLEAAGWRPPAQVITDPAELDALPLGVIVMAGGSVRRRVSAGWLVLDGGLVQTSAQVVRRVSVTVLYIPGIGDTE